MKGSQGYHRRTRNLKVALRDKGKVSIRKALQEFNEGDKVSIDIDPSYQAIPHPRFRGRTGTVIGQQGRAYLVEIKDGGKLKKIIVSPEHLKSQVQK